MGIKKRGIALIWVILTSALILVSIVAISIKVIPEKQILNSREYSQRALAVAEAGLADAVNKVRTDEEIRNTLRDDDYYEYSENDYDSGMPDNSGAISTYEVKIVGNTDGYTFYSLGTLKAQGNEIAKKAVKVDYSGKFPISDYALYSYSKINVQNGTVNGDVFANDSVYFRDEDFLNGDAWCATEGGIEGIPENYTGVIDFPDVGLDEHKAKWEAFLNGTYPYDGTVIGHPNTGLLLSYLVSLGYSPVDSDDEDSFLDPLTQQQFESFFRAIRTVPPPAGPYFNLIRDLQLTFQTGNLVFYIQPDKKNSPVDFSDPMYKTEPFLQGLIIIEGDLKITSENLQIGVDPYKTSILVTGTVNVATACTINGLLYIMGTTKSGNDPALSISANGGLTLTGSVVAKGTIELNSDKLTITWWENEIYKNYIREEILKSLESKMSPVPGSWREIAADEF
jgi:hypothetical protein